jgi:ribose 5-phosphate isomerase B
MKLRVAIAADHGGFDLKQELVRRLRDNVELVDLGAYDFDPHDDYPDYVERVARSVASGEVDRGVVICGSGVGACVAANKIAGVRASVCHDTYSAHQGVEHDDLNVLCLGARVVGVEVATELTVAFLMARFSGEERHRRRLDKVLALEQEMHSYAVDATESDEEGEEDSESPEPDAFGIPGKSETEDTDDTDDE